MKSILLGLISLITISCGGSSGGGGGASIEDGCGVNAMCRNDRFSQTRPLTIDEAKTLLAENENTFEGIYPGMSFTEVRDCFIKEGNYKSGSEVLRYEVKSWDKVNRTVMMKVTREVKAEDNSCASSYFDYDEYVVRKRISGMKTYLDKLDEFSKFAFGKLNDSAAIKMFKTETEDGVITQTESVVDMTKTVLSAISFELKVTFGGTLYVSNNEFFIINDDVDANEIETNGLPIVDTWD